MTSFMLLKAQHFWFGLGWHTWTWANMLRQLAGLAIG